MSAVFSPCRLYRYRLERELEISRSARGRCLFIMLNPSTADESVNDPTIRRCIGFANSWGYALLEVVNIFAWRATDPLALGERDLAGNVGPDNDEHIRAALEHANLVVGAWGDGKGPHKLKAMVTERGRAVRKLVDDAGAKLTHLGPLTKLGNPRHPLYLRAKMLPQVI